MDAALVCPRTGALQKSPSNRISTGHSMDLLSISRAHLPTFPPAKRKCLDFSPSSLSDLDLPSKVATILEGRRIASGASPGRKVRTPQGAMPRNFWPPPQGGGPGDTRGRKVERLFDGQCHRKLNRQLRTFRNESSEGKGEKVR